MKTYLGFSKNELETIIWTMLDDIATLGGDTYREQTLVIKKLLNGLYELDPKNDILDRFECDYEDVKWVNKFKK